MNVIDLHWAMFDFFLVQPEVIDGDEKDAVRSSQSMDVRHASILPLQPTQEPTTQKACRGYPLSNDRSARSPFGT